MKRSTGEWVEKAESDYRSAANLLASRPPEPDQVCFHAQQCAEKYIKAVLNEHDRGFPKTHDLKQLAELLGPMSNELKALIPRLEYLSQWAFMARYPGRSADINAANQANSIAAEVRLHCRGILQLPP